MLMAVPQQGGKVIIKTGVPEADFYLDGNFVAVTDDKGMLTMENFPAGFFNYSIVKKGYDSFKGTFSISEGETRLLSPALDKIAETDESGATPAKNALPLRIPAAGASAATKKQAPPKEMRQPEVAQSLQSESAAIQPVMPAGEEETDAFPAVFVLISLSLITAFILGIRIWRRKSLEEQIPDAYSDMEIPKHAFDASTRPAPDFIEELRRREEFLNAGFVGSKPRVVDQESMKEKEVVIVLPKEAFRYEDDK